jgi:hypothetical protein
MRVPTGILAMIPVLAAGYAANTWFRKQLVSMTTSKASSCLEILGNTTTKDAGRTFIFGSLAQLTGPDLASASLPADTQAYG